MEDAMRIISTAGKMLVTPSMKALPISFAVMPEAVTEVRPAIRNITDTMIMV